MESETDTKAETTRRQKERQRQKIDTDTEIETKKEAESETDEERWRQRSRDNRENGSSCQPLPPELQVNLEAGPGREPVPGPCAASVAPPSLPDHDCSPQARPSFSPLME